MPFRLVAALAAALCASAAERPASPPGVFDYYLLALSWSPQYCASRPGGADEAQCGPNRRFAFVVHGLWPQFEKGYPQNCAPPGALSPALVDRMLPLMPSRRLILHEWQKHGTCSGLGPARYFQLIEDVMSRAVKIPPEFRQPLSQIVVAAPEIRRRFLAANPGFPADSIRLLCSGRFLSEVRICLSKDLKARPCGRDVRDACRAPEIILRPLR